MVNRIKGNGIWKWVGLGINETGTIIIITTYIYNNNNNTTTNNKN